MHSRRPINRRRLSLSRISLIRLCRVWEARGETKGDERGIIRDRCSIISETTNDVACSPDQLIDDLDHLDVSHMSMRRNRSGLSLFDVRLPLRQRRAVSSTASALLRTFARHPLIRIAISVLSRLPLI